MLLLVFPSISAAMRSARAICSLDSDPVSSGVVYRFSSKVLFTLNSLPGEKGRRGRGRGGKGRAPADYCKVENTKKAKIGPGCAGCWGWSGTAGRGGGGCNIMWNKNRSARLTAVQPGCGRVVRDTGAGEGRRGGTERCNFLCNKKTKIGA